MVLISMLYFQCFFTTDDTTVFVFEGSVNGRNDDCFVVNKNDDRGLRSSYSQKTSITDNLRGIRVRHSVTFNAVGNTANFYIAVYG